MKPHIATLVLPVFAGLLGAQVKPPNPGLVRYSDRTVHVVFGLPGNLVLGPVAFDRSDAISFSDAEGLISADGFIQLRGADGKVLGEYASAEANPVLGMGADGKSAVAWLPASGVILNWNGKTFGSVRVDASLIPGVVSAISISNPQEASLLATATDGSVSSIRASLTTGNVISVDSLPGVRGPALQYGKFLVFVDERGLEIEAADGLRQTLPFMASDARAEQMSTHWVHLFSAATGMNWALHLGAGMPRLSVLPNKPAAKETVR